VDVATLRNTKILSVDINHGQKIRSKILSWFKENALNMFKKTMNQHIVKIIYEFMPRSREDQIMNTIYNILEREMQPELWVCWPLITVNGVVEMELDTHSGEFRALKMGGKVLDKFTRNPELRRWNLAPPLKMYTCITKAQMARELTRIIIKRWDAVPNKEVNVVSPEHLYCRVLNSYDLDATNTRAGVKPIDCPERFQGSLRDVYQALDTDVTDYGLSTRVRELSIQAPIVVKTLQAILDLDYIPKVPRLDVDSKEFVRSVYPNYPMTVSRVNGILEALGQRTITRAFKKKWLARISEEDYHFRSDARVGNGNGLILLLTVDGFFDVLQERARTVAMQKAFFQLYKFISRTIRERLENQAAVSAFRQELNKCYRQTLKSSSLI